MKSIYCLPYQSWTNSHSAREAFVSVVFHLMTSLVHNRDSLKKQVKALLDIRKELETEQKISNNQLDTLKMDMKILTKTFLHRTYLIIGEW